MNINDKVVLVNEAWPPGAEKLYAQFPIKDKVYVVRDVFPATSLDPLVMDYRREISECLLLVGVVNPSADRPGGKERGFDSKRFRKLDEAYDSEVARKEAVV